MNYESRIKNDELSTPNRSPLTGVEIEMLADLEGDAHARLAELTMEDIGLSITPEENNAQ